MVWLSSEVTFFGAFFGAYYTLRSQAVGPWPPEDVHLETVAAGVATLALIASSGTMQWAVRALAAGRRPEFRRRLAVTVLLALAFVANQAREWSVADFGPSSHAFGSAFFVMTGFHGLHVVGGIVAMAVMYARSADPAFGSAGTDAVEVVSYYWHFVDVVWLAMFSALFLFP